jgi:hypothetical protein
MARSYKVLGQNNPAATTATTLYTVPAGTQSVLSTISVCNIAATAATYRIAIRPAGETLANKHYVAYDSSVPANDTAVLTLGLTMNATDILTVQASTASVTFGVFGSEIV